MGGDGVSDISAGAGEGVGGMVNGEVLTSGLWQGQEPVGAETHVDNELAEVRGFLEGDRRGFGKKILGWLIRGEDMETFPEDPFETVKARIVSSDERQMMEVLGWQDCVMETTEWLVLDEGTGYPQDMKVL